MLLTAVTFAWSYGISVPWGDDWVNVPVLTGELPVTLSWLWSFKDASANEFRLPLQKLSLLSLYWLTENDFRAGALANAAALSALAFSMIWIARRVRGSTTYADAVLPLALLNLAQGENLIHGWGIAFVISTLLEGTLLLLLIQARSTLSFGSALGIGLCTVLLPLCGAQGLPYAAGLVIWLGYVGYSHVRSREASARRNGIVLLASALAALFLLGLYCLDPPLPYGPRPSLKSTVKATAQLLSLCYGSEVKPFWELYALGTFVLLLCSLIILVRIWWLQPSERCRASGLLVFLGAASLLAVGLAWRRAGFYEVIEHGRYVTLMTPMLCCLYMVWRLYGWSASSRFVQMSLFSSLVALLPLNMQKSLEGAQAIHEGQEAFKRDLLAGTPASILSERHGVFLFTPPFEPSDEDRQWWANVLPKMRQARIGVFSHMAKDPLYSEVSVPVVPAKTSQMIWQDGLAKGFGNNPSLTFVLDQPQFVYAVRLRYSYCGTAHAPPEFAVSWARRNQEQSSKNKRIRRLQLDTDYRDAEGEQEPHVTMKVLTLWVNDTVEQFHIRPDNKPCLFSLSDIILFVPPAEDVRGSPPKEYPSSLVRLNRTWITQVTPK
jgi:hypothetical protein